VKKTWPKVVQGGLVNEQVRTYYRVTTGPGRVVAESRAIYADLDRLSRTVYSSRQLQLVSHEARHLGGKVRVSFRVRVHGDVANVWRQEGRRRWSEVVPLSDGDQLVPFQGYCYADIVYALRFLDWKSKDDQPIRMLHGTCGSEFSFKGLFYVLKVLDDSFPVSRVHCANLSLGPLGAQLEPGDLLVRRTDGAVVGEEVLFRGQKLVENRERMPPKSFFGRVPSIDLPTPRWNGVRRVARSSTSPTFDLVVTRGPGKDFVWLFDLVKLNDSLKGTQAVRQSLAKFLGSKGHACLTIDTVVAQSEVGLAKTTMDSSGCSFDTLKAGVLELWERLGSSKQRKTVVFALEENCHLAPAIFCEAKVRPALLLVNPSWGTFNEWVAEFKSREIGDKDRQISGLFPGRELSDIVKSYDAPVVSMGPLLPPDKLRNGIRHFRIRHLLRKGAEEKSRFWFPETSEERRALDSALAWVFDRLRRN